MADGAGTGTPISTQEIATVDELRRRLQIPDSADDTLLEELLAEAVAAIQRRHPLTVGHVTEMRPVWVDEETSVWAAELLSATKVETLTGGELDFTEEPGRGEHLSRLILGARYLGTVKVTGTWGHSSVPEDYRRAVLTTAGMYYRRARIAGNSASFGDRGYYDDIPKEAAEALERMRARVM